jgi:phosphomannomutase
MKIAVDCGNGVGGAFAGELFRALGCNVQELFCEVDGNFPNHEANPIDPKNLIDLQKRVLKEKADIGLAFDGDADRCFLIDEKGSLVNPSALTALIAVRELKRKPGSTIIYNLISSKAVPEIILENGGTPLRSRVGHSFIKKMMADSGAIFGGEHSGHFYFADFWRADSGMLAALYALTELAAGKSSLSNLLKPFNRYVSSGEINSEVSDVPATIQAILAEYEGFEVDELDGITLSGPKFWFNVRASNTEPLLRLNVEGDTEAQMIKARDALLAIIRAKR